VGPVCKKHSISSSSLQSRPLKSRPPPLSPAATTPQLQCRLRLLLLLAPALLLPHMLVPPCVMPLPRMGGCPSSSPATHRWLAPCFSSTRWMEQPRLAASAPASAQHYLLHTMPPPSPASLLHRRSMTSATVSASRRYRGTRR
jgi:hypothetical protein